MNTGPQQRSNVPAQRPQGPMNIATVMDVPDNQRRIVEALGDIVPVDMFMGHVKVAFSRPEIAACTMESKMQAVCELAALGLLPTLQQAALIVRGQAVTVLPQWQGYKAIFERSPNIREAEAFLVHKTDTFTVGTSQPLQVEEHSYDPFNEARIVSADFTKDIRGGYLKVTMKDGSVRYHFTPVAYIAKCKACAQTANVWNKWTEQMCLKTVFRHAFSRRFINFDPAVAHRIEALDRYDDEALGNDPLRIADESHGDPQKPLSKAEQMAARFAPQTEKPALTPTQDAIVEHAATAPSILANIPTDTGKAPATVVVETEVQGAPPPPSAESFIAAIRAATTVVGVRKIVNDAQAVWGGVHVEPILIAGTEREREIETAIAKAAAVAAEHGLTPASQLPATPPKPDYTKKPTKDSPPEHWQQYTLGKLAEARRMADPNQRGNLLAAIRKGLPVLKRKVDEGQYLEITRQLQEADDALAAECAESVELPEGLQAFLASAAKSETLDDVNMIADAFEQHRPTLTAPQYQTGLAIIAEARKRFQ